MKKIFALLLALCLLVGMLAGCNASNDPSDSIEVHPNTDKYRNFYQIWIGSFCDSNGDETGDLKGIISKLDYLNDGNPSGGKDLGIDGIWLSPMMPSYSYHKYNVRDYFDIDPEFGTLDDFDELIRECHERGIAVVIDLVLNHSASDHPFFEKACDELKEGKEDGYARYYNISKESTAVYNRPVTGTDYYYEGEFTHEMPDWNLSYEGTREYFEEITKFWLERGVDGFRLDAVKYFTDDHTDGVEFLGWFYTMAQKYNPDVYMVGENWDDAGYIYDYYESGIDSQFNFKLGTPGGDFIKTGRNGRVETVLKALKKFDDNIKKSNPDAINANFLTNHDQVRAANSLDEMENKFAAALYYLAPGVPYTYYGEEIGIEAPNTTNDASYRTAMIWDNDNLPNIYVPGVAEVTANELGGVKQQLAQPSSLLNTYRKLIRIRNQNPAIARGNIDEVVNFGDEYCAGYLTTYDGVTLLIVHNGAEETRTVTVDQITDPALRGYVVAPADDNGNTAAVTLSGTTLTMPSFSSAVLMQNAAS